MTRGEFGTVEVGELFGVELDRQAVPRGGDEHAFDLRRRKPDALRERIDRIGEAYRGDGGQHDIADVFDIAIGIAGELRRHAMCA